MAFERYYSGADGTQATQAIVELTEANIPAVSGEAAWAEELGFLDHSAGPWCDALSDTEVDEVIDLSSLLA